MDIEKAWLVCQEPVHIGGAESDSRGNRNPVFRLSDRTPAIPGSSLRGALREGAERNGNYEQFVKNWFGGKDEDISPGNISLSWAWPLWWPVHVLGYGTWWVSCLSWLNRFQQLAQDAPIQLDRSEVYITEPQLHNKNVYLRWLQLQNVQSCNVDLPAPEEVPSDRRIIVPSESVNTIVDMGLVRQPRVSLKAEADEQGNMVQNLFSVEGFPPKAVFFLHWTTRPQVENVSQWQTFLNGEHHLGGLWSVGYGRISITSIV